MKGLDPDEREALAAAQYSGQFLGGSWSTFEKLIARGLIRHVRTGRYDDYRVTSEGKLALKLDGLARGAT